MERRMTPRDRNDLPPEVRRSFLDTHQKTYISRRLVKKCMAKSRWNLLAATLSSNEEKIYIVDENGFTFLVWVPNAKVVPNSLEAKHYRIEAGHIRDQMYHIICWAYGSSDAVSAERVLKGLDDVFQPLDTRYLVRNACPTKLKLRKDPDGRDHHCCYGYNSLKALKFIKAHGIPKEQNIVFDCTQDPPALGDEELIQIDRIEKYETLEEVFVALESHPVLASLRTFEGWEECGEDVIYEGPLNGAPFTGSHTVLIVSIETINGVAVAVCKSSNGTDVGRDGYLYVSLGVMFMLIAVTKEFPGSEHLDKHKDRCDIAPQYLLNRFCWPIIEKPEGSNSRKRKAGNLQSRGADDSIPLSSELAREQDQLASEQRSLSEAGSTPPSHNAASSSDLAVNTVTSVVPSTSSTLPGHASSPIQAGLAVPVTRPPPVAPVTPKSAATSVASNTSGSTPKYLFEDVTEELEEKQTLKEIVHDKRYGALRTLGERKQAFNEEYILDLEKEEEELRRVEKEHVRRAERKNRDAFRTLLEEHVAAGILSAKTYWLDYWIELKDLPQYQAVASNTSGSTPKDLFEDVTEELEKQYHEDKSRVKDALKSRKISMISSWLFEDFKSAISEDLSSQPISDINLKLIYDDLLERLKEKEEKEARKLQRLAEEFTNLLRTFKEITAASNWEDTKQLIEESQEYRSIGDETVSKGLFEEYITSLQEKAKEKERKRDEEKVRKEKERDEKEKRKDKEKERREKEREREKERGKERSSKREESDGETAVEASEGHRDEKRKGKDRDRKHRRRHHNSDEDVSSDKDDREESKKSSRKHGNDRKKSRKHASPESDNENRHKRQKKEQRDSSRRSGNDELEDGEVGEDGEIRH